MSILEDTFGRISKAFKEINVEKKNFGPNGLPLVEAEMMIELSDVSLNPQLCELIYDRESTKVVNAISEAKTPMVIIRTHPDDKGMSLIIEYETHEKNKRWYLSQAASAIKRLSEETKPGRFTFAHDKEARHVMEYRKVDHLPEEIRQALEKSSQDSVVISAPKSLELFVDKVYLPALVHGTTEGLHDSVEDVTRRIKVVVPPATIQEELETSLRDTAKQYTPKFKNVLKEGGKHMYMIPTANKGKKAAVEKMIQNNKPQDAMACPEKVPKVEGGIEQPYNHQGPQELCKRFTSIFDMILSDEKRALLDKEEVGCFHATGVENAFNTFKLSDGTAAHTDVALFGKIDSRGKIKAAVSLGLTIPSEFAEYRRHYFPLKTNGHVLAAFLPVSNANWHKDFSGVDRFAFLPDVEKIEDWDTWA